MTSELQDTSQVQHKVSNESRNKVPNPSLLLKIFPPRNKNKMARKATILVLFTCFFGVLCMPKGKSEKSLMEPKTKDVRKEMMMTTEMPMMSTMASEMMSSTPEAKGLSGSSEMMPMQEDMATTMTSMDMAMTTGSPMTKKDNMGKKEGMQKHLKN